METGAVQLQLEIPKAGLNRRSIDFTFFLNTTQGDNFNPSPRRAKVMTQSAINQVGKLLIAKDREIFFEQVFNPVIIWWKMYISRWAGQRSYNESFTFSGVTV